MKLDYATGLSMYKEAVVRETEDRFFLRWISGYQSEMSFDEFKEKLKPKKKESVSVIFNKVEKILEATINGNI